MSKSMIFKYLSILMVSEGNEVPAQGARGAAMQNGIINCPKCDTENSFESDICYVCGESLHAPPPPKVSRIWSLVLLLILVSGISLLYLRTFTQAPPEKMSESGAPVVATSPKSKSEPPAKSQPAGEALPIAETEQQSKPPNVALALGTVIIKDVAGKTMVRIPTTVVAGSWVALPKQICVGGHEWVLRLDSGAEYNIIDGILGENDQVGIWRIQEDQAIEGLQLDPVAADKSLMWTSLQKEPSPQPAQITIVGEQDHFVKGTLADSFNEPGIFLQDDRCVGWTFGSLMEGGYLWVGEAGASLAPETRVDDFYRITFANSREEELTLALAMGDEYTRLERLGAFANAFRFESKLAADETPVQLQPDQVLFAMRELIEQLVEEGFAAEVVAAFDAQVLVNAADISLLTDVGRLAAEEVSFEDAAELLEEVSGQIKFKNKKDALLLAELRSEIFQNWIDGLIEEGDLQAGMEAFALAGQSMPEDPKIHLLGVRLALAAGDWETAERRLAARRYPGSLDDQVQNLQNQIAEQKGQAGRIVINFAPSSNKIEVTASLGPNVSQQFIVDTGASLVTIPQSTADLLELTIDERNPVRKVATAGGVIDAPEVLLSSIVIEGWEVTDIRALVVDLPGQEQVGLLGLNYLERFRMDLDNEKGLLLLEPR